MLEYRQLKEAVSEKGMLKITTKLSPMGAGGLVYPPTYANPDPNDKKRKSVHVFRKAWIDGELREIVVMDSPQSQANRIEDALLSAIKRGDLDYPDIEVRITRSDGVLETYSVLQLSHRIYDAVLLATEQDGTAFRETDIGQSVYSSTLENASGLFEHAPITLALGGWDSHSGGGPLSAKIPRILTSEIIGVDACVAERGATKFDPMDIRKAAGPVYASADRERVFELDKAKGLDKKAKDPSKIGLGSVPSYDLERGASIRYALQSTHISLPAIRRIGFPLDDGTRNSDRDLAGRTVTVALALLGLCLQREAGYWLRSGCDLMPIEDPDFQIIGTTLSEIESTRIDSNTAKTLLNEALTEAVSYGLKWRSEKALFTADNRLRDLVDRSRADRSSDQD